MDAIAVFTPEQLKEFTAEIVRETLAATNSTSTPEQPTAARRFVRGLRGIAELFNVSHTTAQIYKDSFLRPAVIQRGRIIMIDAEKAIELFNEYQSGK